MNTTEIFLRTIYRGTFMQMCPVQQASFRSRFRAIFSQIWLIWNWLMFYFTALLLIVQAILYIWKKYRQNTGDVNLLACSIIIILIKYFVDFNHLELKPIHHCIVYKSFCDSDINVTDSESSKIISHFK